MHDQPYHLRINDRHDFHVTEVEAEQLDVCSPEDAVFHILHEGKRFQARLTAFDFRKKTVYLHVNDQLYQVRLHDHFDELIQRMGLTTNVTHRIKDVKAPMPGLVLSVAVEPGDTVKEGDTLLILEAMKMENVIKSSGEGVVKSIPIEKGKAVDKGDLLIEME